MDIARYETQEDGTVFSDMLDHSQNPCFDCGACCNHFRVSFYQGELESLGGTVPDSLTESLTPFLVCMKGTEVGEGRCVALQGEPGKGGIRCGIYARRPSPCRAYHVWDDQGQPNPDCQRLRAPLGLAPLKPLEF